MLTKQPPFMTIKIGAPSGVLIAQTAEVENTLSLDGCSYPITIAMKRHAPSPATEDRVAAFAAGHGTKPVAVSYRLTGFTAKVDCGFNTYSALPEIDVLAISAPCGTGETFATTCVQCGPAGGCAKEETKCTPTCSASAPCATGTCANGVCSLAPTCI